MHINCVAYGANSSSSRRDEQGEQPTYEKYNAVIRPDLTQQNLLIRAITMDDASITDESITYLTPVERAEFLERLYNDAEFKDRAGNMIPKIPPQYQKESLESLLHNINQYPETERMRLLMDFLALAGTKYSDERIYEACILKTAAAGVHQLTLLIHNCPDIYAFTLQSYRLQEQIRQKQGVDAANAYLHTSAVLAGLVYGPQYEYMSQLGFLTDESNLYSDPVIAAYLKNQAAQAAQKAARKKEEGYTIDEFKPPVDRGKREDAGKVVSGGVVTKRQVAVDEYEDNIAGVGAVVEHLRALDRVPFVVEGKTGYQIFYTPETPQYQAGLNTDANFALMQVEAMAKVVKSAIPASSNGSRTTRFHRSMQKLLHPNGMNSYNGKSRPSKGEEIVKSTFFDVYQKAIAKNPSAEFYGLA